MKRKFCLVLSGLLLFTGFAFSDTVYLENDKELKGIIVEEYTDRIVISTHEGEKTLLKKDIHRVIYDLPEQNLVKLGDAYLNRGELEKAYFYYEKALKINPKCQAARDKINYIIGYLFRKVQKEKMLETERMQALEDWPASESKAEEALEKRMQNDLGIRIKERENRIKITEVQTNSPASLAGLEMNDTLISVWGRFTDYMSAEDVGRLLLDEGLGEIKIGIERNVALKKAEPAGASYKKIIGGNLRMLLDGLTLVDVAPGGAGERAGLKKNDLIVDINGVSTRYMPLGDAIGIIEDRNQGVIIFTVRRNVTVWRK